jgi:hypothetical protein
VTNSAFADYIVITKEAVRVCSHLKSLPVPPRFPLIAVLDTPGLDLGLAFRTFTAGQQSVTQMIVGDSRCGIRVYQ